MNVLMIDFVKCDKCNFFLYYYLSIKEETLFLKIIYFKKFAKEKKEKEEDAGGGIFEPTDTREFFEPTETGPNDSSFQSPSRLDLKSSAVWLIN